MLILYFRYRKYWNCMWHTHCTRWITCFVLPSFTVCRLNIILVTGLMTLLHISKTKISELQSNNRMLKWIWNITELQTKHLIRTDHISWKMSQYIQNTTHGFNVKNHEHVVWLELLSSLYCTNIWRIFWFRQIAETFITLFIGKPQEVIATEPSVSAV